MSNLPLTNIIMAAADLKAASPNHFQTFCNALREYELSSVAEMIASDAPDVFRAQGKVKTIQQLRKHITECTELREQYLRR